jgi:hypothetical protein
VCVSLGKTLYFEGLGRWGCSKWEPWGAHGRHLGLKVEPLDHFLALKFQVEFLSAFLNDLARYRAVQGLVRRDVRCQWRGRRLRLRACKDLVNLHNQEKKNNEAGSPWRLFTVATVTLCLVIEHRFHDAQSFLVQKLGMSEQAMLCTHRIQECFLDSSDSIVQLGMAACLNCWVRLWMWLLISDLLSCDDWFCISGPGFGATLCWS